MYKPSRGSFKLGPINEYKPGVFTTQDEIDVDGWLKVYRSAPSDPEQAIRLAMFELALNDWLGGVFTRNCGLKPGKARIDAQASAKAWFEDKTATGTYNFNFIAEHLFKLDNVEGLRYTILHQPGVIRRRLQAMRDSGNKNNPTKYRRERAKELA